VLILVALVVAVVVVVRGASDSISSKCSNSGR
jgi:hypothetical protein